MMRNSDYGLLGGIVLLSVMNLKPDDVLVFSTVDKLSAEVYQRVEQKIINWKKDCNINNKHLLLTSALELKVLRPEKEQA